LSNSGLAATSDIADGADQAINILLFSNVGRRKGRTSGLQHATLGTLVAFDSQGNELQFQIDRILLSRRCNESATDKILQLRHIRIDSRILSS